MTRVQVSESIIEFMPRKPNTSNDILEAALIGFQHLRSQLEQKISDLRTQLGHRVAGESSNAGGTQPAKKRTMSAAARRRIALAQKKRWAAQKAAQGGQPAAAKKPKRVLSAAGRARIIAATKKRWETFRKAQSKKGKPAAKKAGRKRASSPAAAPGGMA